MCSWVFTPSVMGHKHQAHPSLFIAFYCTLHLHGWKPQPEVSHTIFLDKKMDLRILVPCPWHYNLFVSVNDWQQFYNYINCCACETNIVGAWLHCRFPNLFAPSSALYAPVYLKQDSPSLTCLGQQCRHAPRHEEDTADKAHLYEKHLPPLANFKYFRNYCLFGRASRVVPLHASQLGRRPLFCVLESRRNCRPDCLFTRNRAGMWSSFQAVQGADGE